MPYTGGFPKAGLEAVGAVGVQAARGKYDFAVDGGVSGDIQLTLDTQIPAGAIILGGFAEVVTVPTSAGAASLALKVEGAGDIIAAVVISGAPWSTVGRKSVIPVFTGATSVKTTAARKITATVAVADLTAGVINVCLFYVKLYD